MMRFFFPDSQDLVSPTYDFLHDEYSPLRVRQRDDLYAHEVLESAPYDGLLVSKAIVDGSARGAGKYSAPQRERLYRLGIRRFFRLPDVVESMGDCGAFNYVGEDKPPYTVNEVLDFYESCGFDSGVSVDHLILSYDQNLGLRGAPREWRDRRKLSLHLAEEFLACVRDRRSPVRPVGAAQGWSPKSYADSVRQLQDMGYDRIALGGMVPLKTPAILACLEKIDQIRKPDTELHLLGITRIDSMGEFSDFGVVSFDSTSAFRQAFMDDRRNYHTASTYYVAVRVPQVDGNITLKRAVLAGVVSQREAVITERECLKRLRGLDDGTTEVEQALEVLSDYERITMSKKSYLEQYRRTLTDAPWRVCPCALCREHGVDIAIFRGTERNKRRGFHNLFVLRNRMQRIPTTTPT